MSLMREKYLKLAQAPLAMPDEPHWSDFASQSVMLPLTHDLKL